jgi:hypothetical protein
MIALSRSAKAETAGKQIRQTGVELPSFPDQAASRRRKQSRSRQNFKFTAISLPQCIRRRALYWCLLRVSVFASQKNHAGLVFRALCRSVHSHIREAAMMNFDRRTILALAGSVVFAGSAFAEHNHHDGVKLIGAKLTTDGKHELHKVGEHTVSVHVQNKKIAAITVMHRTRGDVPVKKYKTSKKMVQADGYIPVVAETSGPRLLQPADYRVAQSTTTYVGYSFFDGVSEQIYWYPADMVVDPVTGAVDYVPV